ncbi:phospholipid hydroperoxide glutathione peroxidase, partial [Asbolus verrucosus]
AAGKKKEVSKTQDAKKEPWQTATSIYEFNVNNIKDEEVSLEKYRGNVCIIVNVASKCGHTKSNYEQFVELHEKYAEEKGLRILAFPCNQFGGQEPGDSEKICKFAESRNVKFDMFKKIKVNGKDAHPLWKFLKEKIPGAKGKEIKWNFTKFIINDEGIPVERHQSSVKPLTLLFSVATTVLRVFSTLPPVMTTMSNPENPKAAKSIYEFSAKDIKGNEVSLEKYKDHVCIIVNVASQCGYTENNYAELVDLYDEYAEKKGLRILAFPCNQFAGQEPGTNEEICQFASAKNVKFDIFEKVNVNGNDAHPLWKYLKHKQGGTLGDFIKWNFTKFIIDKNGQPVERHGPSTNPKDLVKTLAKYW